MADDVVDALRELVEAFERNRARLEHVMQQAAALSEKRELGDSWVDIIRAEERPLIVEVIGENLDEIYTVGGRLRRSLAKSLHDEGLSMEQIARLFGVTRQRVSALLRSTSEPHPVSAD